MNMMVDNASSATNPGPQEQILEAFLHEKPMGAQVYFERVVDRHMPIPVESAPQVERVVDRRFVRAHRNTQDLLNVNTRRCSYCSRTYSERDNIGQWKCSFHPGVLEIAHSANWHHMRHRWSCCDRIDNGQGCVRCDHCQNREWSAENLGCKVLVPVANFFVRQGLIQQPLPQSLITREEVRVSPWTEQEMRHSADIRDPQQEAFFQQDIMKSDGLLVARTDYYNLLPLVQMNKK